MAQDLKTLVAPNSDEVGGEGTQISYSTSRIDGSPRFSHRGPKDADQTFAGDEIELLDTALGTEVTVTVDDVADLHVIAVTLLIPEMWVAPGSGLAFRTIAIYVAEEEPLTGKIGLPAAREQFATVNLRRRGQARRVLAAAPGSCRGNGVLHSPGAPRSACAARTLLTHRVTSESRFWLGGARVHDLVNSNLREVDTMFDDESDLGENRSPAPDAAPEDNPEPDALEDADVTSGTVGTEAVHPTREGEAKDASDTTPQEAGTL